MPRAEAFKEHGEWGRKASDDIQLPGAHQRESRGKNQERKRRAEETLGRQRGVTRSRDGRSHGSLLS